MPQKAWSAKRERQYKHIKASAKQDGASNDRAEELAARIVNKNRAQAGESKEASKSSLNDKSPQSRGGQRAHRPNGPKGPTRDQLYNEAKKKNIKGRSKMTKAQLAKAVGK